MKFDLKRPCANCPFRKGQGSRFNLPPQRLDEIYTAPSFPCHKTVDYDRDDDDGDEYVEPFVGGDAQACAGLAAVQMREEQPGQMLRIAERLGMVNLDDYDPKHEAYEDWWDVLDAHDPETDLD